MNGKVHGGALGKGAGACGSRLGRWLTAAMALAFWGSCGVVGADRVRTDLEGQFGVKVRPFLETYCLSCHGREKTKGDLDLSGYTTVDGVARDYERWKLVREKLEASEMPPDNARLHPDDKDRAALIGWIKSLNRYEARKHAGDPGPVLARRLSNSEYDYTIRDLTGVDIQPAREFPVDPSNTAGFDNSGESLVMSPALLKKYLRAAREVASHLYLKVEGFAFAPHPMLVETDRDQFCVQQIIDFYHRQNVDYGDYFRAAWRFKHRAALGRPRATLAEFAAEAKASPKYLATVWALLEEAKPGVGPPATLQRLWRELPEAGRNSDDAVKRGCERMRDYVVRLRRKVELRFLNLAPGKLDAARQPLLMWKNRQYAGHRMDFDADQLQEGGEARAPRNKSAEPGTDNGFGPGKTILVTNPPGDPDLFVPAGQRARYEAAFARFCRIFPDMFYKQERGRNYFDTTEDRGRYLSAGYHNLMGYFRDDAPLYELLLDAAQQKELDRMWYELDFVAFANSRTYIQFYFSGSRNEGREPDEDGAGARPEDREITSSAKIAQLEKRYLDLARGGDDVGINAVKDFFRFYDEGIHEVEKARLAAEPSHLDALLAFAERAYRRPLSREERDETLAYYHAARDKDGLDHEAAVRDTVVSVLMSPDFCYRLDLGSDEKGAHALSDQDLASRLSYFLWSSLPDRELLAHAAAGDLHQRRVIVGQARRMLTDARAQALAVEFGGNWLDFRRFDSLTTVDRNRFPNFNNDLRRAMFEEPARFLSDVFARNRSILDCLYARDTFVNGALARHYGMPEPRDGEWRRVDDADRYGRGGLLPMAAFLTKNAPGLRTSPVKRGNWVVKNILGERIPPPPPVVPELPRDEAKLDLPLRDMLARHRADARCASCHARFDALGLVFEGYGPTGERREKDLAGRPVDTRATFPGGGDGAGLEGLRRYIHQRRESDFVDNFCGKLLAFALGRSLIPSDDAVIQEMRGRLAADQYRFDGAVEAIITSPQFLNKRGRGNLAEMGTQ